MSLYLLTYTLCTYNIPGFSLGHDNSPLARKNPGLIISSWNPVNYCVKSSCSKKWEQTCSARIQRSPRGFSLTTQIYAVKTSVLSFGKKPKTPQKAQCGRRSDNAIQYDLFSSLKISTTFCGKVILFAYRLNNKSTPPRDCRPYSLALFYHMLKSITD